jgi:hypothetical protein
MPTGRGAKVTTLTLARRERVASLYLQGWSQSRIAAEFSVQQQMISKDLHAIRALWRKSLIRNFDDAKSQELAKIDAVEVEYWAAWMRSQAPEETTNTEQDNMGKSKAAIRRIGQVGDPRFLEGVERCIKKRCELLGLNAPERKEISGIGGLPLQTEIRVANEGIAALLADLRASTYVVSKPSEEQRASAHESLECPAPASRLGTDPGDLA